MNVNAAGASPTGGIPQAAAAAANALLPLPPSPAAGVTDKAETLLAQILHPAVQAALHLPEDHAEGYALADSLIRKAAEAIAAHDLPRALHSVSELLTRQPSADLRVLHEPALAPIRSAIGELTSHLAAEARADAQRTLSLAAPLAAAAHMPPESPAVIALANQFLETGQYVNYIRAGQLGQLVISWSQAVPGAAPKDHAERSIHDAVSRLADLWRRAPLLVLLVAWLLLGVALAPLNAEFWATGFLALVALQFVVTIRSGLRRR